ncbi:MAG: fasciclin domain-containing protein [Prevotellaceae bacterium]|nr:fasciclin domain-containing protein [Prevotellaceae bacterium]
MNKRFCKLGQYAARAFFLFAMCGATYSCKDDYIFDDGDPSWLGSSIYEYLESQGNYTNFVKLINDLDYKEVLARTGSKTLFVANDEAFSTFYQSNPWGVSSYDQLTLNQKKLLLNSVMINNAYLLEMMSSTAATGEGDNAKPNIGECLRRETAADVTDSISYLTAEDIPTTYNANDKDYWERFRTKGIYLAIDATAPMMTHFLAAQMANKNITNEDFTIITGRTREAKDAFIYDSKVLEQDITCQNGYVNRLDRVLLTPQNMAEVLRTNGQTQIFSHMIDRFSAPFYNAGITDRYRLLYGDVVDSVFQKRYFSARSQGGTPLNEDFGTNPQGDVVGKEVNYKLNFDPGWNTYTNASYAKEQDMGVIFAPTDEKLMEYFFSQYGGGRFLLKAYAPDLMERITPETDNYDIVYQAIDQIPLDVIQALINNLMKISFINSVPSKFETIKNDAQDPMFDEEDDYHRNKINGVLLANNGVIYLMDEVTTPARYAAVSAPAYVETDKRIFNWAIQRDKLAGINVNYYAYLLAMSSRFSFFVPTDDFYYVDPLSFISDKAPEQEGVREGRAYHYTWDTKNNLPTIESHYYYYDLRTGTGNIGENTGEPVSNDIKENRLKDMLETHTIIHEDGSETTGIDETETGMECNKHYFTSKNHTPIYVQKAEQRSSGMLAQGGMQIQNGNISRVTAFDDKSAQTNGYGNGYAYTINTPILPTIQSVYSVLYNTPDFSEFLDLCKTDNAVLSKIGIADKDQPIYRIFEDNGGITCFDNTTGRPVDAPTNVRFLNNYQYTLYVPTNEAIQEAHRKGLPTWKEIRDLLHLDDEVADNEGAGNEEGVEPEPEDEKVIEERNTKAKAMVTAIVNFVKNHFQDRSIFADTNTLNASAYETSTINSETNVYCKVTVQGSAGNLTVKGEAASSKPVSITNNKNIIARDYRTKSNIIDASSSIVIHGIDGVLDYKDYPNGRYDADWATAAKARNYLKKFQLLK